MTSLNGRENAKRAYADARMHYWLEHKRQLKSHDATQQFDFRQKSVFLNETLRLLAGAQVPQMSGERVTYLYPGTSFPEKFSRVRQLFPVSMIEICSPAGNMIDAMYAGPENKSDVVDGAGLFSLLCEYVHYYLRSAEAHLIKNTSFSLASFFQNCRHIVEFGAGGDPTKKTLPILSALQDLKKKFGMVPLESYTDVDNSAAYLASTMRILQENITKGTLAPLTLFSLQQDFHSLKNEFDALAQAPDDIGFLFLGGTVGNPPMHVNVPNPDAMTLLRGFNRLMKRTGGRLATGQDCTEDVMLMMLAYYNEFSERWTKNLMHRWGRDLDVKFNPALDEECSNWQFFARWNTKAFCMEMGVTAKVPHTIAVPTPRGVQKFDVEKGTILHFWNSFKNPAEFFKGAMLVPAGFNDDGVLRDTRDPHLRAGIFLSSVKPDPTIELYTAVATAADPPMLKKKSDKDFFSLPFLTNAPG